MTAPSSPPIIGGPTPGTRRVLLDTLWEQIKSQDKQFESLRTVSSILLAAAGVVLTQTVRTDVAVRHPLVAVLLLVGAVTSSAAAIAAILVVMPATLHRNPKPQGLVENYFNSPVDRLESQLITELRESYHKSEPVTARMAVSLKVSAYCLGAAVVALLLAAVMRWGVQTAPEGTRATLSVTVSATAPDTIVDMPARARSLTSSGRESP